MNTKILITGTAGFIGFHTTKKLLEKGYSVIGIDNLNDYYDVRLKKARLNLLKKRKNFIEIRKDIANKKAIEKVFAKYQPELVLNLAGQAGVTHSLLKPHSYIESNILGFLNILEGCRKGGVKHLVFASTASVYGANKNFPYKESQNCDHQLSLYASTKKANESMAHAYSYLFGIPTSGVRFFNVYGEWGRPDMALFIFTKNILQEKPIKVFNYGNMIRDFTYVQDIAEAINKILLGETPKIDKSFDFQNPKPDTSGVAPYQILNIGNQHPVQLMDYIRELEEVIGKKAEIEFLPKQAGETEKSEADSSKLKEIYGFIPKTDIKKGIRNFYRWYKDFYNVK